MTKFIILTLSLVISLQSYSDSVFEGSYFECNEAKFLVEPIEIHSDELSMFDEEENKRIQKAWEENGIYLRNDDYSFDCTLKELNIQVLINIKSGMTSCGPTPPKNISLKIDDEEVMNTIGYGYNCYKPMGDSYNIKSMSIELGNNNLAAVKICTISMKESKMKCTQTTLSELKQDKYYTTAKSLYNESSDLPVKYRFRMSDKMKSFFNFPANKSSNSDAASSAGS